MNDKQFLKGALVLTAAGLFSKVLSAGYRVPLQNMAGDEGIYIYQQIYPFLMIAWMLSLYGYPAAISKVLTDKNRGNRVTIHLPMLGLLVFFNLVLFCFLYFGSTRLAEWMGDPNLATPIRYASILYIIIPFTSILRGGFQGNHNMKPSAVSQSVEQLVRVFFILYFTYYFLDQGKSLYEVGNGAVLASTIAVSIGLITLLLYAFRYRGKLEFSSKTTSTKAMGKALLTSGIIVSLNYLMLIFIQLVDNLTMIPGLLESGLTLEEAKLAKGIFDRGQPFVQLGIVFGSSIALALIPSMHIWKKEKQLQSIHRILKLTFVISIASTLGLILILPSLNIAFFKTSFGIEALSIFMIMIVVMSITLTLSTFLQSYGFMKRQALLFGITLMLKYVFNLILVPFLGIVGSALSSVLGGLFLVLSFAFVLRRHVPVRYTKVIVFKPLLIASLAMTVTVILIKIGYSEWFTLDGRWSHFIVAIGSSMIGAIVFIFIFMKLRGFTKSEIEALPFGDKLITLFKL
ncbi:putative polysaccharide biosynthesis protein [Salirhabdus sp. Marseille-P4669]|uniref:putative polysaccharide biosynthesis protein n=1 Tax=Salirhabdus sp. Marseille-P4669 TaxID=2042310 RepID=UPI000C7B9C27|nr:polysaccharide biosynthesis protein [Salirhabdus sp. Marseille-P4669]